MRAFKLVWWP